jgi:hypothetical protein
MLVKATLSAAISVICSPAICDELRSYTVTVMEQIRHEITVGRMRTMRREPTRYWRRAEPQDLVNLGGDLRRQLYWRMRVKLTALR